jgi:hypothetical protein
VTDEEMATRQPAPWQPEKRPTILALIGKLGEESSELSKIAARIVIQGLEASCPDTGRPNRELLEDEIADVAALCGLTMQRCGPVVSGGGRPGVPAWTNPPEDRPMNYDRVEARRAGKVGWFTRWLATLSDVDPTEALRRQLAAVTQERDHLALKLKGDTVEVVTKSSWSAEEREDVLAALKRADPLIDLPDHLKARGGME